MIIDILSQLNGSHRDTETEDFENTLDQRRTRNCMSNKRINMTWFRMTRTSARFSARL